MPKFLFPILLAAFACKAGAATPEDPVGKTFWIGATKERASPVSFISRAEPGFTTYGQSLKVGQTFKVESAAMHGELLRYRIIADDGRELFIDADDFDRVLFSDKKYRDQGAEAFSWEQHVFTGPPDEFLKKAVAADAARAAAARQAAAAAHQEWLTRPDAHLGMTRAEALNSRWGAPEHVNRTTTARGISEQWAYSSGNFLYFDDGILVAIQD